jgi:fatty-acyl-CoA synthase
VRPPLYRAAVDSIREQLENVRDFIALDNADEADAGGWLTYEKLLADGSEDFSRPSVGERDLLTIRYTSGTTSRPKGVMVTHRNAYMNVVGTLIHLPMTSADRYLRTLPMFHANGWTFTWTVTRPCTSACRNSMPRPARSFQGRTWVHVRPRAAEDRDREDSEIRAARRRAAISAQ